jgi:hypothetical protein
MMGRCAKVTAWTHRIMYLSGRKITQDVHKYFASGVGETNMVILKQHALNGWHSPLEYSRVQEETI